MRSNPSRDRPVGVLGLGAMGLAIAGRLAQSFAVVGYDPINARVAELEARGAAGAASPAEVAAKCVVLVVAVRDAAQLENALYGPYGAARELAPLSSVIITSTIGPAAVKSVANRLGAAQVDTIDAPVSGGPRRAASGDLLILVGADSVALARAEEVLNQIGSHVRLVGGSPGYGQTLKIVNQLLCGIHIVAAAEALALAQALGLDPGDSLEALTQGGAASFMLADRGPRMLAETDEVHSTVDIFVKDMAMVTDLAADLGQPVVLGAAAYQVYLQAKQHGHGADDDSAVIKLFSPHASESAEP